MGQVWAYTTLSGDVWQNSWNQKSHLMKLQKSIFGEKEEEEELFVFILQTLPLWQMEE